MAFITDGRFSGATHGICICHAAPEAAAGAGGLELVSTGDTVTIDVTGRSLNYERSTDAVRRRAGVYISFRRCDWASLRQEFSCSLHSNQGREEAISVDEALAIKRSAEGYGGPLRGTLVRRLPWSCFACTFGAPFVASPNCDGRFRCRHGTSRPLAVPVKALAPGEPGHRVIGGSQEGAKTPKAVPAVLPELFCMLCGYLQRMYGSVALDAIVLDSFMLCHLSSAHLTA